MILESLDSASRGTNRKETTPFKDVLHKNVGEPSNFQ